MKRFSIVFFTIGIILFTNIFWVYSDDSLEIRDCAAAFDEYKKMLSDSRVDLVDVFESMIKTLTDDDKRLALNSFLVPGIYDNLFRIGKLDVAIKLLHIFLDLGHPRDDNDLHRPLSAFIFFEAGADYYLALDRPDILEKNILPLAKDWKNPEEKERLTEAIFYPCLKYYCLKGDLVKASSYLGKITRPDANGYFLGALLWDDTKKNPKGTKYANFLRRCESNYPLGTVQFDSILGSLLEFIAQKTGNVNLRLKENIFGMDGNVALSEINPKLQASTALSIYEKSIHNKYTEKDDGKIEAMDLILFIKSLISDGHAKEEDIESSYATLAKTCSEIKCFKSAEYFLSLSMKKSHYYFEACADVGVNYAKAGRLSDAERHMKMMPSTGAYWNNQLTAYVYGLKGTEDLNGSVRDALSYYSKEKDRLKTSGDKTLSEMGLFLCLYVTALASSLHEKNMPLYVGGDTFGDVARAVGAEFRTVGERNKKKSESICKKYGISPEMIKRSYEPLDSINKRISEIVRAGVEEKFNKTTLGALKKEADAKFKTIGKGDRITVRYASDGRREESQTGIFQGVSNGKIVVSGKVILIADLVDDTASLIDDQTAMAKLNEYLQIRYYRPKKILEESLKLKYEKEQLGYGGYVLDGKKWVPASRFLVSELSCKDSP